MQHLTTTEEGEAEAEEENKDFGGMNDDDDDDVTLSEAYEAEALTSGSFGHTNQPSTSEEEKVDKDVPQNLLPPPADHSRTSATLDDKSGITEEKAAGNAATVSATATAKPSLASAGTGTTTKMTASQSDWSASSGASNGEEEEESAKDFDVACNAHLKDDRESGDSDEKKPGAVSLASAGGDETSDHTSEEKEDCELGAKNKTLPPQNAPRYNDNAEACEGESEASTASNTDTIGIGVHPSEEETQTRTEQPRCGFSAPSRRLPQPGAYRVSNTQDSGIYLANLRGLSPPEMRQQEVIVGGIDRNESEGDGEVVNVGQPLTASLHLPRAHVQLALPEPIPLVEVDNVEDMDAIGSASDGAACCTVMKRNHRLKVFVIAVLVVCAIIVTVAVALSTRGDNDGAPEAAASPTMPDSTFVPSSLPSANDATPAPSLPPTTSVTAPESERFVLLSEIVDPVSADADLSNPLSPQYKAISWLAYEDAMNISASDDPDRLIKRYIAVVLFFSTANVPKADSLEEIMIGDECTWNRPNKPPFQGIPQGIVCSESGRIISVNFGVDFRPIAGTFPEEVGYLPHLQNLFVSANPGLIGTIPNSVACLQDLRRVYFGRAKGLTGTMPSFTAPNLRELVIGNAPLNGTIPSSIGNLSKLVTLIITNTDITGTVPEFVADLKGLAILNMAENRHTGSLPASLGRNQSDLVLVNFGNNNINRTIPSGLLERDNMRGLFLHGNQLTGTVGSEFGHMVDLKRLVLYSTLLSSNIPPELGNSSSLEYLELGDNRFTGIVPPSLGSLPNLKSISLKGNPGLHGDLNFFCDKSISNFFTDCALSNPNLECECCECCRETTHTCGLHPDGKTLIQTFLLTECCRSKVSSELQCGKDDCTGDV